MRDYTVWSYTKPRARDMKETVRASTDIDAAAEWCQLHPNVVEDRLTLKIAVENSKGEISLFSVAPLKLTPDTPEVLKDLTRDARSPVID